jgi:protein-arginine kinase activator protein McsA
MLQPKCDICGEPATIHETTIESGKATSRHFCQEHGAPSLPPVDKAYQAASLRAMEEYYHSLSDAERENMALLYRLTKRGI